MPITINTVSTISTSTEITGTGAAVDPLTIAPGSIANSKLANMAANTIKGNNTGAPGSPADLTTNQAKALLSIDDLITLSGVADGATSLGTFTGTTIPDSQTIKSALQALETALEAVSGSVAYDSLSSGAVTAAVRRMGGSAVSISTPGAGQYTLTIPANVDLIGADIFGNNTTLNGANEFVLRINNTANSRDRRVTVQVYDVLTGAVIDQHATSTNHTQTVGGNITLITLPGMNLFGATGFRVLIS